MDTSIQSNIQNTINPSLHIAIHMGWIIESATISNNLYIQDNRQYYNQTLQNET